MKRMLKEGEHLDGIGLLKRFGGSQPSFESTSDIASVPFARFCLQRAQADESVQKAIAAYRDYVAEELSYVLGLTHNGPDGRGFGKAALAFLTEHESRAEELSAEEQGRIAALRQALSKAVGGAKPSPYYVLLVADGDGMGRVIEELSRWDGAAGLGGHVRQQVFSRALSRFAARCRDIVGQRCEQPIGWGNLIYAGGDDVMALLPVDTALATVRALYDAFAASVSAPLSGVSSRPTLSAAMVIAHSLEDLGTVRKVGENTLHRIAKEGLGRNSLAITLMKRSGEPLSVGGKWDVFDRHLSALVESYADHEVPFGLGYEWGRLADLCRRAKVREELVGKLALSVLKSKAESAHSRLAERAGAIQAAAELRQLADELVLARQIFQCSFRDVSHAAGRGATT